MQTLPLALFLVLLELTVGSFASLVFLDVRGDTSRGFVIFQGALYLVFALLTLLAMNAFATPELVRGYGLDVRWLRAQGPLVLAFSLLLLPWNVLLWSDRAPRGAKKAKPPRGPAASPPAGRALLRFALGRLIALVGFVALFVDGMAYRTLAESRLNGAFVVATFLAGGLALGGVMTAMLLGHWYLNTPTASGRPLEFATTLMLGALVAELLFTLLLGNSTAHPSLRTTTIASGTTIVAAGQPQATSTPAPAQKPAIPNPVAHQPAESAGTMSWLQLLLGFLAPLTLGAIALHLTRGRSFQSATGMLYLCVAFIFMGEILGRGLLVSPIFA